MLRATLHHFRASNQTVDSSYVKCGNYGLNHTANYKGCAKRSEFAKMQAVVSSKKLKKPPIYQLKTIIYIT